MKVILFSLAILTIVASMILACNGRYIEFDGFGSTVSIGVSVQLVPIPFLGRLMLATAVLVPLIWLVVKKRRKA